MTNHTITEELKYHAPFPVVAVVGFGLAVVAVLAEMLSGLGSRMGWWYFRTGLTILRWGAMIGAAALVIEVVSSFFIRGAEARLIFRLAMVGIAIGLVATLVPAGWLRTGYRVPAIHDITTDTVNPPGFVAMLPLRQNALNPAEYGGPEVAAKQQAAYPNVKPLYLPLTPEAAFQRALAEAVNMGWAIVDSNPREGRIEATDTTFWFGFRDDIVVRVTPAGPMSRVDVRSVSRVGLGDLGTNARRITNYLDALGRGS